MRLSVIINRISNGIISFFEDSITDVDFSSEVKGYEKKIFSQGKNSSSKYLRFLSKVDNDVFKVDDKSLKQSVRSRIQSNSKLAPFIELFDSFVPYDEIVIRKVGEEKSFNDFLLKEFYSVENWEIVDEYIALVKCAERELRLRRIKRILAEFSYRVKNPFFVLHMQMQLTTSFLSFFDQRFTLKKSNSENAISELLLNVKCKFDSNGRENYRIIPITC